MQFTGLCLGVREESFDGKKGRVNQKIALLLDQDTKCPLNNLVDYVLREGETAEPQKLLVVGVRDFRVGFGGKMRLIGQIAVK